MGNETTLKYIDNTNLPYIIVSSRDLLDHVDDNSDSDTIKIYFHETLEYKVMSLIQKGYMPYGDPFYSHSTASFNQAMVFKKS